MFSALARIVHRFRIGELSALALALGAVASLAWAEAEGTRPLREAVAVASTDDEVCMTHEDIVARTAHWLGRDQVEASIEVQLEARGEQVFFVISRAGEAPARRTFDVLPRACAARQNAVGLAIAIAIDPDVLRTAAMRVDGGALATTLDASEVADGGAGGTHADAGIRTDAALAAPDASRDSEIPFREPPGTGMDPHPGASVGAFLQLDGVPGLAAGGSVAFELGVDARRLLLRLGGLLTSRVQSPLGSGQVRMRLALSRLDACGVHGWENVGVGACLGLGLGLLVAEGRRFETNRSSTRPLEVALGRFFVQFPARSSFGVRLSVEGMLSFKPPRVHVENMSGVVLDRRALPRAGALFPVEGFVRKP